MSEAMKPEQLRQLAERVVEKVKGISLDLKGIKGVMGAFKVAPRVVEQVEALGQEFRLVGTDKKQIAVNAVLALVPDRWVPDWVLEPVVSWAIEKAVAALKQRKARGA